MSLQLWLPASARDTQKVYKCNVCQMRFPEDQKQQWRRHTIACIRKNPEHVEELVAAQEASIFTSIADKEKWAWVRKRQAEGKRVSKGVAV